MAEKTTLYDVQITPNFIMPTRGRCGMVFNKGEVQSVELTKDQVEEFKNDRYFSIKKSKGESGDATEGESEERTITAEEADAESTDETDEAATVVDVEEVEVETEQDRLVRENSRDQLNSLAEQAGVENPAELATKTDVASAIIAAKE